MVSFPETLLFRISSFILFGWLFLPPRERGDIVKSGNGTLSNTSQGDKTRNNYFASTGSFEKADSPFRFPSNWKNALVFLSEP